MTVCLEALEHRQRQGMPIVGNLSPKKCVVSCSWTESTLDDSYCFRLIGYRRADWRQGNDIVNIYIFARILLFFLARIWLGMTRVNTRKIKKAPALPKSPVI
jgi:hypothetical protein